MNEELIIPATLTLLQNRAAKIMLKQIVAEVNDGHKNKKEKITYEWLCKFNQGFYLKNPPEHPKVINKIEKLNKYLVSKLNTMLT